MSTDHLHVSHIILAEDDEDDKEFFVDVVRHLNSRISVEAVPNGLRLMELLHHFHPELLFLDLDMPYKNGLECLLEIRSNERLKSLPVIVFSSTTRPANIQTAYEMGAHLYLIKSPTYGEYAASLKGALTLDWSQPEAVRSRHCVDGRYAAFS